MCSRTSSRFLVQRLLLGSRQHLVAKDTPPVTFCTAKDIAPCVIVMCIMCATLRGVAQGHHARSLLKQYTHSKCATALKQGLACSHLLSAGSAFAVSCCSKAIWAGGVNAVNDSRPATLVTPERRRLPDRVRAPAKAAQ